MSGQDVAVDLPHFGQQKDYTCGPAALRMVLEPLLGIKLEEDQLEKDLGTDAHIGTRQRVLAKFVMDMGLEAVVHHTHTRYDEIAALMADGHVVIVCYWLAAEDTDHYAVVTRISADELRLHDPWVGPRTRMSREAFEKHWYSDSDVPGRKHRWLLAVKVPV